MSSPATLLLALATLPLAAGAQHPYHHFTDAVATRFARSQPVISYRLRVDSSDLSGFAVEMRIRNAPDTVRLAMAAHPEYDDRYWRHPEGLRVETRGGVAAVVREDSAVWRVVAPAGDLLVRYRIRLPTPPESPRAAWRPFLAPTGGLVGGPHAFLYVVGATLAPSHVVLDLPGRCYRLASCGCGSGVSTTIFCAYRKHRHALPIRNSCLHPSGELVQRTSAARHPTFMQQRRFHCQLCRANSRLDPISPAHACATAGW